MPVDPKLMQMIINAPFEDTQRLRYATASDAEDSLRAEFIRLQVQPDPPPTANPENPSMSELVADALVREARAERQEALLASYGRAWAGPIAEWADAFEYDRGFVAGVTLSVDAFMAHGEQLMASAPIQLIRLSGSAGRMEEFCEAPALVGVAALHLGSAGLVNEDLAPLMQSPHVEKLWWLQLEGNEIDFEGVNMLAAATNMPALVYVGLASNPCDPIDTIGVDGDTISDVQPSPEGEELEERHGQIPWLHHLSERLTQHPPNPFGPPPT